jgi:hypothetical protein
MGEARKAVMKSVLSSAQLYLLERASARDGRISTYGTLQRTLDILQSHGLIEVQSRIRDAGERATIETRRDEHIRVAYLTQSDWRTTLAKLRSAESDQNLLDATAYWITDAGREMVSRAKETAA